jgi:cobalamin biosynthesis protein CobD/CbiB
MESRPPPNLKDPLELAAYRRELRGVASGVRWGGIGITLIGAAVAVLRAWAWPAIPALVPMIVVVWGMLLMLTAIALRMAYHAGRMRGG